MALLPITYPEPPAKAIASFNFIDIAEGTGNVIFFCYAHQEQTTVGYSLSTQVLFSEGAALSPPDGNGFTEAIGTSASFQKEIDIDFDLAFNLPQRIKGKLKSFFTWGCTDTTDSLQRGEAYVILRVRKWDGSTETEIANAQSKTLVIDANEGKYATTNMEIDLTSVNHFKKGESLRITIEVWFKKTAANNRQVRFYHDPQGNTILAADESDSGFTNSTIFQVHVPFLIDL